jgi:hypothetical protein
MRYLSAGVVTLVATLAGGCSDPASTRANAGIKAAYDKSTGKLTELTLDANHDGRADTWTDMDGSRPVQTRTDTNADGKVDRWEYYDPSARLVKVGFSRKDDGKPDAWAFSSADGKIERLEISSTIDEKKIDRWEHYAEGVVVAAEEDTDRDGSIDKWETYRGAALASAAFDENRDGKPDRRLSYQDGALSSIETNPDASGKYTRLVDVK